MAMRPHGDGGSTPPIGTNKNSNNNSMLKLNEIIQLVIVSLLIVLAAIMIVAHAIMGNWETVLLFTFMLVLIIPAFGMSVKEVLDD